MDLLVYFQFLIKTKSMLWSGGSPLFMINHGSIFKFTSRLAHAWRNSTHVCTYMHSMAALPCGQLRMQLLQQPHQCKCMLTCTYTVSVLQTLLHFVNKKIIRVMTAMRQLAELKGC